MLADSPSGPDYSATIRSTKGQSYRTKELKADVQGYYVRIHLSVLVFNLSLVSTQVRILCIFLLVSLLIETITKVTESDFDNHSYNKA